ncbi:MAG TPA: N(4)-(beta-N-acetylglucosaminyl)-L-asparaginase [Gemmatimonadales bacterium]|jgi:N4-(beta-N-acetylglucosaminyl)-L-asparaginase
MTENLSRRSFVGAVSAVAGGIGLGVEPALAAPAVRRSKQGRAAAVASSNGLRAVQRAGELLAEGIDTLDAAIEGVKIQELDPNDQSVGYGGLPNEEGVVQLDASCMHGPSKRAGAVAALEGIKTPSVVAKYVLLYTDHVMLVGEGAKRFALSYGFKEEDLLTEASRERWLRWRANRGAADDWLDVPDDAPDMGRVTGTINCNVVNADGDLSSVTTTSGLSWKIPGRVGDSPIIGAGQYTDNDVGAAGSTGRGESAIQTCGSFLVVEFMRRGMAPTDACLETLRRVLTMSEPRLIGDDGRPTFGLSFYAVNKRGEFGAATFTPSRYAAWNGETAARYDTAYLFEQSR